jgi:8-amino-7-oxononanoate synthase
MATLGKALGTAGAFIAGSEELVEYLIQHGRSYIYTTAMPAAVAAATLCSLQLLETEAHRRQQLAQNIAEFRQLAAARGISLMPSDTAIQPVLIGDAERASQLSEALFAQGFHLAAIRPPTVPANSARLRITLRADHRQSDLTALLDTLATLLEQSR